MTTSTQANEQPEMLDEREAFLSGPPRSGELSPLAQKLAAQVFVLLCSVVVFGSTANFASHSGKCSHLCRYSIATGVFSTLLTAAILCMQSKTLDKRSWLSSKAEVQFMFCLTVWWTIGVACLSAFEPIAEGVNVATQHTSGLAIMFGWLAFFGSIFGTYKAYHSRKEELKTLRFEQIQTSRATEEDEYANFT